ncbi:proprotein convertase P-domain-containing protein, partial [bacterium]|nr:proprotein convertase P-domain-containing protein [bacterium]
ENFNSRIFPPEGWTIQTLNTNHPTYTWFAQDYLSPVNPHDPPFNAGVLWDSTGALQDEWLISPAFSLPEAPPPDSVHPISWDLSFKWMMSYYWGVFPHDNYDLELRLSLDGGANFNTVLWTEDSVTTATFNNFEWYTAAVDMVEFANNPNARLAWRYSGEGGAEAGIDVVSLSVPRDIIPIPDNGTASWPIEVATPDIIEDLDITLNVTHPYISDMSFALESPFNVTVQLVDVSETSPAGANLTNTRFDDQASQAFSYADGTSNYSGSWIPAEPLSAFNGHSAQGTWTLIAADNAAGDSGSITDVTLHINSIPPVETDIFEIDISMQDTVRDLDVILNITHPMISEMTFMLESPSGTQVQLVTEEPYNLTGENFVNTRFDDEADVAFAYADSTSNYTGSWRPYQVLHSFDGLATAGIWKLIAIDHVPGNEGTVDNVELIIDTQVNTNPAESAIPAAIQFHGNYPNPFNPSTNLMFDLPVSAHVSLNIYNTLGRQVASLINEQVSAGSYSVQFDGVNLASGIYFAVFEASDYHQTHKMILLK